MTRQEPFISSSLCVALAIGIASPLRGADPEPEAPVKVTLHPAAPPTPALKYRLLPGRLERIPGNAAVHYGKVTAEERTFFGDREMRDNIDRWQETPLDELRKEKVYLPTQNAIEGSIRRGAHCRHCDWQLPIGEVPFYGMLLPELQQTREFGKILGARARLQVADGQFADAAETLKSGYSLARHVAAGETFVNGLVGIAVCQIMSRQVLDFVQQPDAPNLYWALTVLPSPLIELDDAVDVEAMGLELSFPELRDVQTAVRTPEQWRELFHCIAQGFFDQFEPPRPPSPDELDEQCRRLLPVAKEALIADGVPAETVAHMPLHQIGLLYSLKTYHALLDDALKYYCLPFPQAVAGIDTAILRSSREQREIIPLAERLMPAVKATRSAMAQNDRRIAVLRVLEALRIYGASHAGKLPAALTDITEVPVPDDPVTGRPFVYRLVGRTARLEGPTLRNVPLNYEITMVPRD